MCPGSLLDWFYNEVKIGAPMQTACEFPDFHALALFSLWLFEQFFNDNL